MLKLNTWPVLCAILFLQLFPCFTLVEALADGVDLVLVEKANRKMFIKSQDRVIREYAIALGRTPIGPKQREGDGKTPEGNYIISGRNYNSAFHRALKVSYPNQEDIARARSAGVSTGGDIMIHGLPNGFGFLGHLHRLRDWTNGCIAVTDPEIEEVWKLVKDGTKVRIVP